MSAAWPAGDIASIAIAATPAPKFLKFMPYLLAPMAKGGARQAAQRMRRRVNEFKPNMVNGW
jgi:hypothetical protein